MNKNWGYMGPGEKNAFCQFFLSTDDPIIKWNLYTVQWIEIYHI